MPVSRRAPLSVALLILLASALLVALGAPRAAHAAGPAPCQGILFTDATGDTKDGSGTTPVDGQKAQPNEDIEAAYVTVVGGVTTINIQIVNLDKKTGTGYFAGDGGTNYYAYFTYGGNSNYVKATNNAGTIAYGYGVTQQGSYLDSGSTKGAFAEGPHGVVSIEVPASVGGKPGETLKGLYVSSETIEGQSDFVGFNHVMDSAGSEAADKSPDISAPNGVDYTVKECAAGGGGGGGTGTATPTASTTPASGGSTTPTGTFTLPFKASSTLGSAKKAKKAKALKFKVTAGADIQNLHLALKPAKGGVAIATTTIASLKKGTTTIKLKVKKIKAGKYVLAADGTSGGRQGGTTQSVKVKK